MLSLPDPVEIERVSSLVKWVENGHWFPEARAITLWFRGHKTKIPKVQPGFLRANVEEVLTEQSSWEEAEKQWGRPIDLKELEFNKEFLRRAASFVPDLDDLVEVYLLAQHHGAPTRLLDWTTNPLAALFFAASGNPNEDGEIIVATPSYRVVSENADSLEDLGTATVCFPKRDPLLQQAVASLFGEYEPPSDPEVFFIVPDLTDPRVAQQGSCFSLHMCNKTPISERVFVRLPVPARQKPIIQESLRTMGVSWATLFPDLDHVCREMQASWGFEFAAEGKNLDES